MRSIVPEFVPDFDRTMVGLQEAMAVSATDRAKPEPNLLPKFYRIAPAIAMQSSKCDSISTLLFGAFSMRSFQLRETSRNPTGRGAAGIEQRAPPPRLRLWRQSSIAGHGHSVRERRTPQKSMDASPNLPPLRQTPGKPRERDIPGDRPRSRSGRSGHRAARAGERPFNHCTTFVDGFHPRESRGGIRKTIPPYRIRTSPRDSVPSHPP